MMITNTSYHRHGHTLRLLLEDLAEKSGLGVVFVNKGELLDEDYEYITRANFCSLCSTFSKRPKWAQLCNVDHQKRAMNKKYGRKFHICHAGLFNISFPIELEGEIVASILIGQKKLSERKEESNRYFNKFLQEAGLTEDERTQYQKQFAMVDTLTEREIEAKTRSLAKNTHKIIEHLLQEEKFNRARVNASLHELLIPMQSLIIEAENIKEETYEDNMDINYIRQSAPKILAEVDRLNFHARNLQKVMEMPAVKSKYEFKNVPVYPLIEQARKRFELEATSKGIILKSPAYTGGTFPNLKLAQNEMLVVLNNLYSNAVKYSYSKTPSNKERHVSTECTDETHNNQQYFVIEISNFGVGILREEIISKKIFAQAFRGSLSRDRNRIGMGVGLFLVKEIVDRIHNGMVHVTSEDRTTGYLTTVKIMLPY